MHQNVILPKLLASAGLLVLFTAGCHTARVYNPKGCDSPQTFSGRLCDLNCTDCGEEPCSAHGGYTFKQFLRSSVTCGSGCGEIYWGEWSSDPPDACDPCDDHQNWIGRTPGKRPLFWRLHGFQGGRFHENCEGCPDCSNGTDEVIVHEHDASGEPTPAPPPAQAPKAANPPSSASNWSARRVGYWQLSGRK